MQTDFKRTVVIDNSSIAFSLNKGSVNNFIQNSNLFLENAFKIKSWRGEGDEDNELNKHLVFLVHLAYWKGDLLPIIKKIKEEKTCCDNSDSDTDDKNYN